MNIFWCVSLQDGLKLHVAFTQYHLGRPIPPVRCWEFRKPVQSNKPTECPYMYSLCWYNIHTYDPSLLALVLTD